MTAVLVGAGVVTAVGLTLPATAAAVRAGLSALHRSDMLDGRGEPLVTAQVPLVRETAFGPERLLPMSLPALQEAIKSMARVDWRRWRSHAYLGVCPERPGFPAGFADSLLDAIRHDLGGGPEFTMEWELVPQGHAAVHVALEKSLIDIAQGRVDWCLVGGVDTWWHPETVDWLDAQGRLGFPDGFLPGEGAGFLVLSSPRWARQHSLQALATVRSVATAEEPHPLLSNGVSTASGLTVAVQRALAALSQGERADQILCDMNGESYRATEWGYAYLRTGKQHRDPLRIAHPADCYGDVGAASGAVLIGLAATALQRGYARGDRTLVWTASDHGPRGAVIITAAP